MNEIEVILRETGERVTIQRSDFNIDLHKEIEDPKGDDQFKAIRKEILDGQKSIGDALKKVLEASGAGKVERGRVAAPGDVEKPAEEVEKPECLRVAMSAARTRPGWEREFDTISDPDIKRIHTPENAVLIQRWMVAKVTKDQAVLREIADYQLNLSGNITEIDRQLSTAATEGGELVPQPLSDMIVVKRDKRERIAPNSMRVASTSQTLRIPVENVVGAVNGIAENAAITPTDSSFAEVTLTKKKAGRTQKTSWELTQDMSAAFSLQTILSNQAARKLAVYMDAQSAADGDGTGTNHTDALEENSSITEVTASGVVTDLDAIQSVFYALPSEYRASGDAVWMVNATQMERIGKLTEGGTADNRPLFNLGETLPLPVSDVDNAQGTVLGKPILEVPFATNIMMFGSLREGFAVLMDGGIRVDSSTEAGAVFEADQVIWRFLERRDSAVVLAEAFKKSQVMTS